MIILDFENKCPKTKQNAIEQAILFAASELMPRYRKPIYINIHTIRKLAEKKGIYGDVMDEGDREFTIRVDVSLPLDILITTILHEMVHVWQYLSKKMIYKWIDEVKYDKKIYSWDMFYDDRPWEIEAHELEKELKEKWDGTQRY